MVQFYLPCWRMRAIRAHQEGIAWNAILRCGHILFIYRPLALHFVDDDIVI